MKIFSRSTLLGWMPIFLLLSRAEADQVSADKIYHPYVQALEQEVELRTVIEQDRNGIDHSLWRLGYGRALSDEWSAEVYLIGERDSGESFKLAAYELEAQWQITGQGEYAADWGLLFELEKEQIDNIWEFSTALLIERQWGRYVGTANISATYEWGDDIKNELETGLALQGRYRWSPRLEPALELHVAENLFAAGPALLGTERLPDGKKVHWETGLLMGLDGDSPNLTFRALLEYEF